MKNWFFEKRIIVNSIILGFLIVGVSLFSLFGINRLTDLGLSLSDDSIPGLIVSSEAMKHNYQNEILLYQIILAKTAEERREHEDAAIATSRLLAQAYVDYEPTIHSQEDRDNFERLKRKQMEYLALRQEFFALIETDHAAAERFLQDKLRPVEAANMKLTDIVLNYNFHTGEVRGNELRKRVKSLTSQIIGVSVLAISLAVAILIISIRDAVQTMHRANVLLEQRIIERTRELETAYNELKSFSYSVSHDLRTPLRGINGFTTALIEDYQGSLNEEARGYLKRIEKSSRRMGQIIDDLLNLSQVNQTTLKIAQVNLSQLAEKVVADLRASYPHRIVQVEITPNLVTKGDPRLIRSLLENLLGNAWKYTGKKTRAEIKFGSTQQGPTQIFSIEDNGAGFDMRYADRLFKNFQRLHDQDEFEGNGIGLAIVFRIIQRHFGTISAQGEPDKGASFFFTLPSEPSSTSASQRELRDLL